MIYKITGVSRTWSGDGHLIFGGFRLHGVCGSVDPFVDGNLIPNGSEMEILTWAEEQVGGTLECDGLSYMAFATTGKVTIDPALKETP